MVLTPADGLVMIGVILLVFAAIAWFAEQADKRDARRLRDACRARLREETWKQAA